MEYNDLSERQKDILAFIKKETKLKGYPPAVREIGKVVGLSSSSTVHNHLIQLEKKGYIKRDPSKPRAIEIIDNNDKIDKEMINVPIVGRVTAGTPILAVENIEDTFPLPYEFIKSEDVFMLNVVGDSMINCGILNGDKVIVKKQNYANDRDIVVALIEDEATVKRFFKGDCYVRLQPENDRYDPIIIKDTQSFLILGKVTGLLRQM
ncbi:MAG: transcriptional repressor LexA [Clostridia bacterium]|nr:transcriptional repressor LexA [Clostridia bacterium]MDD4047304.1 transcriptional repressor LexA [Clostridia bacterium]